MTDKSKAIRIIAFSGKQEDWNCWSKQFLATKTARGHREVLKYGVSRREKKNVRQRKYETQILWDWIR